MTKFDILYEIGEVSDGGRLADKFLERFLKDVDGLNHTVESIESDMKDGSVSATIKTRARVTDEWFSEATVAVKV